MENNTGRTLVTNHSNLIPENDTVITLNTHTPNINGNSSQLLNPMSSFQLGAR